MKSKKCKKTILIILYVFIGLILATLCVFNIAHGPKNLSAKIKTKDIEYIVIEPYDHAYTIDSDEDIKVFKRLVRKAVYYKAYRLYLYGYTMEIEIHYLDGTVIGFGPHVIRTGDETINVYYTNFDADKLYSLIGKTAYGW